MGEDIRVRDRDTLPAEGSERAHRELGVAREPELAHDEHVERSTERIGDDRGDGHPAARKRENDEVVARGSVLGTVPGTVL